MKLTNETNWNTKQFKAFIRRVAEHECLNKSEIDKFNATLRYRKRTHARPDDFPGGYAYYKTWTFCISVVKDVQVDKVALAKVIAHELAHCQGVHHGVAMKNAQYGWATGWRDTWKWAEELPLTMNTLAAKPDRNHKILSKVTHCLKMIVLWERKTKLAKTKHQKWERKLKYHQKQLKMAAQPPEEKPCVESCPASQ